MDQKTVKLNSSLARQEKFFKQATDFQLKANDFK